MTHTTEQNLYSLDAHLYDLDNRDILKHDIPFFLGFASQTKGNILELACGTGRLTIPLAEEGNQVWGVELSEAMLEQFKLKMKKLPVEIKTRIHLLKADMSDFQLDKKFPLIILPNRSFQLLYEREKEEACLRSIFNHLTEDGHFIIDIGDFVADGEQNWVKDEEVFDWENTDPRTGHIVRRTHIKKEIDRIKQIIYPQKNYYIMKDDVIIQKIVKRSPWKYFSADQVRKLLLVSGFSILKEMGSYDGKPLHTGSEFIFICRKK